MDHDVVCAVQEDTKQGFVVLLFASDELPMFETSPRRAVRVWGQGYGSAFCSSSTSKLQPLTLTLTLTLTRNMNRNL